jgi:hypothetical protein
VLDLSNKVGPAGKEQLRYFPGFLFVMLSYCSSFVLKTIRTFPAVVPNAAVAVETVRRLADFMVDLGLERGHAGGAFDAGQAVLRQISAQRQPQDQQPSSVPATFHGNHVIDEQQWLQDVFERQLLDSSYSLPDWDETFNFR